MSGFAKQTGCPTSAALSAYGAGTLSFLARRSVSEHLAACEFCGAELSLLLAPHAPAQLDAHVADAVTAPPMPLALRMLAESILSEMHAAPSAERRAA